MVNEVHNNDLSAALSANAAVLDFNATWCNPCRMLGPVLAQVSEEMDGKVQFYGIDVDDNPALAEQFGISSIPALVVLKNGSEVARQVGFVPKPALTDWLSKSL